MRSVSKCCELGNITLIQMVLAFAKSIFFFGSLDGESCRECSVFLVLLCACKFVARVCQGIFRSWCNRWATDMPLLV